VATEVRRFVATIAPGTAISSPATTDMSFPARVVEQIDIRIPPGPMGEVGFALGAAGVRVIPLNAGAWIVGNDELIEWPLSSLWDSGSWTFFAYNTGRYPHTIEVRFHVSPVGAVATLPAPLPSSALSGSVDLSGGSAPITVATPPPVEVAPPPAIVVPAPPALVPVPAPVEVVPVAAGGGGAATGLTESVGQLYTALLGRQPDAPGVAAWLQLSQGNGGPLTWPQLVVRFAGSAEALLDASANPDAFVAGLYSLLLDRGGAPAELGYWTSRLRSRANPGGDLSGAQVAAQIAGTDEAKGIWTGAPVTVTA
jgi:hypothetical protein